MKLKNIVGSAIIFISCTTLSFFDINNHLDIGPADQNGFTPLNHGVFGTLVKIALVAISIFALAYLLKLLTKSIIWTTVLVIILVPAIICAAGYLAFALWF